MPPPGADRFVERVVGADRAERLAVARAEALDRGVVEQDLADRAQHETVERSGRALRQRVEAAQAFERVAEEIEPDRLSPRRPGRDRRCRRAPRIRRARAPCRCGYSRCCGRSPAAGRAGCGRPAPASARGRRTVCAAARAARRALTVVSSTNGRFSLPAREPGQRVDAAADDVARSATPGHRAGSPRPGRSALRARDERTRAPRQTAPCGRRRGRHAARLGAPVSASSAPIARRRGPRARRTAARRAGCSARRASGPSVEQAETGRTSRRARGVAEGEQQAGHLGVVFGRAARRGRRSSRTVRRRGSRAAIRNRSSRVLVEPGEMRLGERAEDQVGLARAAVPGAEQQPLAANIGRAFGIGGLAWLPDIAMLGGTSARHSAIHLSRMRPALLDRLFAPVTALPGIGPQLAKLIERAAGPLVVDLLWHLPTGIIDRRAAPPIGELNPRDWPDAIVTVQGRVEAHQPGIGRRPYRGVVQRRHRHADAGLFQCQGRPAAAAVAGRRRAHRQRPGRVSTAACRRSRIPTTSSPPDEADRIRPIEPVYPLTAGLSPRVVAQARVAAALRARAGTAGMARPGACANGAAGRAGARRSPPRTRRESDADLDPDNPGARAARL